MPTESAASSTATKVATRSFLSGEAAAAVTSSRLAAWATWTGLPASFLTLTCSDEVINIASFLANASGCPVGFAAWTTND